jgi:hypothetical protein
MRERPGRWSNPERLLAAGAVAFMLVLHGAVPFLMMPTVGQAVWSMGFAQSFANGSPVTLHAHDFGLPAPAAIAFGLAGAWPASLLIRLGLGPADAYAAMAALWLLVAFGAAFRIGRMFGAHRSASLIGALAWTGMPVVWAHAGYSMLSLGIALLAFYFLAALRLFLPAPSARAIPRGVIALYVLAAVLAVFMDGYTFAMFATGASILLVVLALSRREIRPTLLRVALPVHLASFALAYALYGAYIGRLNFAPQPLDTFRGWGLDLAFAAIPSRGTHWLPDLFGLSVKRSAATYFGDESVWVTTFSLPLIVAGLAAWRAARKRSVIATSLATGILLVAVFGFYMALGPSLKINTTRPASLHGPAMPAEFTIMPTGNAWISQNVPGFNVMRASYRWTALAVFALWLLVMIALAGASKKNQRLWLAIVLGITLLNLPNMPKKWQNGRDARAMFLQVETDLVPALRERVRPGDTVVFLPWGNDFMANYLAARTPFRTLNIGGDKNLAAAQARWPPAMIAAAGEPDPAKAQAAVRLLVGGTADVLVVPYFHMLWAAHLWPCVDQTRAALTADEAQTFRALPGFVCPSERKAGLAPFFAALRATALVDITDTRLFAVVRLRR